MTDLDKQLQEIASKNWQQFAALIGDDAIKRAKVCLLRGKGKSYQQVSMKLGLSENQVRYACNTCDSMRNNHDDTAKGCE